MQHTIRFKQFLVDAFLICEHLMFLNLTKFGVTKR